jgi:hypothetical protein
VTVTFRERSPPTDSDSCRRGGRLLLAAVVLPLVVRVGVARLAPLAVGAALVAPVGDLVQFAGLLVGDVDSVEPVIESIS